jgi:hypothetical protein
VGWIGMFAGVISGAIIGLFFHQEGWLGGYSSFRRRITRLGHISFWGLGFINVMFALSVRAVELPIMSMRVASLGFMLGLVTMPLCCFLTAWRKSFRFLFPVPVICVLLGVLSVLIGWGAK